MSAHKPHETTDGRETVRERASTEIGREADQSTIERINPIARAGWWCISKVTAPVTATKYSVGQCVEIEVTID